MPLSIPNTTLADVYTDATTFAGNDVFAWGFVTVANNPAFLQLLQGPRGGAVPQPEVYCPPATYPIAGGLRSISGLRARNAVAGSPAQLFGSLFFPNEPGLQAGTPFTDFVAASGAIGGVGQLDYQEVTAGILVNGAEGAPVTLITFNALSFVVATRVLVEVFFPAQTTVAGNTGFTVNLWDESPADLGRVVSDPTGVGAANQAGFYGARYFTTPIGTKTYRLRAWIAGANVTVQAGAGGAGTYMPGWGRISTSPA